MQIFQVSGISTSWGFDEHVKKGRVIDQSQEGRPEGFSRPQQPRSSQRQQMVRRHWDQVALFLGFSCLFTFGFMCTQVGNLYDLVVSQLSSCWPFYELSVATLWGIYSGIHISEWELEVTFFLLHLALQRCVFLYSEAVMETIVLLYCVVSEVKMCDLLKSNCFTSEAQKAIFRQHTVPEAITVWQLSECHWCLFFFSQIHLNLPSNVF